MGDIEYYWNSEHVEDLEHIIESESIWAVMF